MQDSGWKARLDILRDAVKRNMLDKLVGHGWEASIIREVAAGEYVVVKASRGGAERSAAVLYSSATSNSVYKQLAGEVSVIFFNGQPYMVESFAMGISIPVKPIDDFQPLLIEWNRESSTGKFAPTTTKAEETSIVELQAPRRVLLSETPIEAVWARLAQLKSATLARKMVDRRAQLESLSLDPSTIVSKGEGVAFALRNATDYFSAIDRRNVSQRVLNLYYGTMSFAFAEMLASPSGPQTLSELEATTKKGHGLYTHDGLDDRFESLAIGALVSGFFPSWVKSMSANSLVAAKRKPDGLDALKALPVESWLTMEQLFSRIPEVADLFEDIFEGKPSWVTPAYDQESNGRHHRATTTYALLIDESGRMTVDDIAAFPGAIREIIQVSSRSSASHFRVAIDHPESSIWWDALQLHHSPFKRHALMLPLFGTINEYRATCLVLLYALSILVRYRPSLWRQIQEGELDHFRSLIETFLSAIERILPEQFLEKITGQSISVHQPGSFFS
ncbi:YaaC family protein [Pseudomonas thivervalensis]|uniref:YaaC family protein n=1 Tax=Pseudomonas thivervalensis TaxID=86265 RepID=UPI00069EC9B0|nr:hypothetical protein [Pseudomonas thivervalensis]